MSWPKAMPIVEAVWIDSNHTGRWHGVEELERSLAEDTLQCRTVGYVFEDRDDRVTIVQSISQSGCVSEATTIPRGTLVSMTVLKPAED